MKVWKMSCLWKVVALYGLHVSYQGSTCWGIISARFVLTQNKTYNFYKESTFNPTSNPENNTCTVCPFLDWKVLQSLLCVLFGGRGSNITIPAIPLNDDSCHPFVSGFSWELNQPTKPTQSKRFVFVFPVGTKRPTRSLNLSADLCERT